MQEEKNLQKNIKKIKKKKKKKQEKEQYQEDCLTILRILFLNQFKTIQKQKIKNRKKKR